MNSPCGPPTACGDAIFVPTTTPTAAHRRRWLALALLCAAESMVVVDLAVVNVALPAIQNSLGFDRADLAWVVIGYTLTFGGFLMLGGRLADLLGRRRIFLLGLAIFTVASLACGLAASPAALIAARAAQGLGGALLSPAALSVIGTLFREGHERNKALAVWGGVSGLAGAGGVLIGGLVTEAWGWEWIFLINIPVGVAGLLLAFPLIPRDPQLAVGERFDVPGAVALTGGLALLVLALARSDVEGVLSLRTLGALTAAVTLLILFVAIERITRRPLMPLELFSRPNVLGTNVTGLLYGGAFFATFFFMSLHMQQVLGYSAAQAGLAYLPMAVCVVIAATASQGLVSRYGARLVLMGGLATTGLGIASFILIQSEGSYFTSLAPGFIVAGIGFGLSFVPISIAALHRVEERRVGAASGLINSAQEIGGALGIALLVAVAAAWTPPAATAAELVPGFRSAFAIAALMCLLAIVVVWALVSDSAGLETEASPTPGASTSAAPTARVPYVGGPMGQLNPYPAYITIAAPGAPRRGSSG